MLTLRTRKGDDEERREGREVNSLRVRNREKRAAHKSACRVRTGGGSGGGEGKGVGGRYENNKMNKSIQIVH